MAKILDDFDTSLSVNEMTKALNNFDSVEIPKRRGVDFEDALDETGFGKYNVFLILVCGLILFATVSESSGVGYIIPASECELNLNSYTKGILTSTNVIGTMSSCIMWGYLSDFKGRKNLLMITLVMSSISGILAAFTPSFWGFCLLRLINGMCISCPAAVIFVYLGEFLSSSSRGKSMTWSTSFIALAMISLPSLGWLLLQSSITIEFFGLHLNNWRIFMLINSTPSLLGAMALLKLPESPKYLYYCGKTEEALCILKKIYSINSGKPEHTFPVLNLDEKILEPNQTKRNFFQDLAQQFSPLFKPPFLSYTLVCCFMEAVTFAVSVGLYFWYPDIIKQISNSGKSDVTVCEALSSIHTPEENDPKCDNTVNDSIFILNIIIGVVYLTGYATWGAAVKLMGLRGFFITCMGLSTVGMAAICLLSNKVLIDIFFISFLTLTGISVTVINAWVVNIFPTQICGVALCIVITMGRLGNVISTSIMGIMLEWNCVTTFLLYVLSLLVCIGGSLLLPHKN